MKNINVYLMCFLMLCMTACGSPSTENEDNVTIKIINAASDDIYGLGYAYYIDGNIISSGGVCNADNSVFKDGEVFTLQEFPESEEFRMELSVEDENGNIYDCAGGADIKNGESYHFQITGDFENGFELERIEM